MTTKADLAENALDRAFEAERPNDRWVVDVMPGATEAGWLSLAA